MGDWTGRAGQNRTFLSPGLDERDQNKKTMAEESVNDQSFDEGSSALQEIIVEEGESTSDTIIRTYAPILFFTVLGSFSNWKS